MNKELLDQVEKSQIKKKLPNLQVGDTVAVHNVVREGERKRVQIFKGLIIAIKGSGTGKTITVRKISYGVGVEKVFPVHSPNVEKIELLKHANVRRSKLYYMRDRVGKAAMKLRPGRAVTPEENMQAEEAMQEEVDVAVEESPVEDSEQNGSTADADKAESSDSAVEESKDSSEEATKEESKKE